MPQAYDTAKRGLDVVTSAVAVVVLSPLILLTAAVVLAYLGRPVLFRQLRPGMNGQPFTLFKFRTMREARDAGGGLLSDSERLDRFGKVLRASSLDELPELWNVLRGDMSIVGPRPLLMEYLPLYDAVQRRRHDVRPGITGWAQVNGRNALSWADKFKLDVWYVENRSLWLDIRIVGRTILGVFRGDGISAAGEATMPRFTGAGGPNRAGK